MLNSTRSPGFSGPEPIKLNEIMAFFQLEGITALDEREEYVEFLLAMDAAYLGYTYKATKEKQKIAAQQQKQQQAVKGVGK